MHKHNNINELKKFCIEARSLAFLLGIKFYFLRLAITLKPMFKNYFKSFFLNFFYSYAKNRYSCAKMVKLRDSEVSMWQQEVKKAHSVSEQVHRQYLCKYVLLATLTSLAIDRALSKQTIVTTIKLVINCVAGCMLVRHVCLTPSGLGFNHCVMGVSSPIPNTCVVR